MTYQEFKTNLWTLLDLDNRSIIFTIVDSEFGVTVESGMVETSDDLYDTDIPDLLMDHDGETAQVYSTESWLLGSGEADHASCSDVGHLQTAMDDYNRFFDRLIWEEADPLCSLGEFELETPTMRNLMTIMTTSTRTITTTDIPMPEN